MRSKGNNHDPFQDIPANMLEAFLDAALDNYERYSGSTIVLKFGGEMVADEEMLDDILRQAIKLKRHKCNVILVHGGGSQISDALKEQDVPVEFDDNGKRICDENVVNVAFETLRGLNKSILVKLNQKASELGHNIVAMGEAGYNGGLIRAEPINGTRTGEFKELDADWFKSFVNKGSIPVVYTICMGPNQELLNVNADDVAAALAKSCDAKRLIMVTDVSGVWDSDKKVIPEMTIQTARQLIADGTAAGGMKPKLEAAISVAEKGIDVVITTPKNSGLFKELFTVEGSGTMIRADAVNMMPLEHGFVMGAPKAP